MKRVKKYIPKLLSIFIVFVFVQSLFFKFTNSPETQHIFGTLDAWAASFGFAGLFVPPGPFNAYVIGSAELAASLLLLIGLFFGKAQISFVGALLSLAVISGAIIFHMFTPLGIEVQGDGGTLFFMAVGIWISSFVIILSSKDIMKSILCRFQ